MKTVFSAHIVVSTRPVFVRDAHGNIEKLAGTLWLWRAHFAPHDDPRFKLRERSKRFSRNSGCPRFAGRFKSFGALPQEPSGFLISPGSIPYSRRLTCGGCGASMNGKSFSQSADSLIGRLRIGSSRTPTQTTSVLPTHSPISCLGHLRMEEHESFPLRTYSSGETT
jgi:hypothetical protein